MSGVSAQLPNLPEGVIATGTQGPTNPPAPTMGTPINQTSYARMLSINSIDDFCLFAPPTVMNISESESFEVAWCTKPRNNARVIPDGTFTGLSFLKTDFYIQIMGYGDFTRINIPFGDWGGELDPHGALGDGNPIGGNVTSNISGVDVPYAEWMLYISYEQFCLRVCTNANSTFNAAQMCEHKLDVMGCQFVMPGNYNINGTFETCEAEVAYPPGWYPVNTVEGTPVFSAFNQRFTGTNPDGEVYTVGDLVTPPAPYMTPSSSNCVTTSSIANGIALESLGFTSSATPTPSGSSSGSGNHGVSGGSPSRSGASAASQSTGSAGDASAAVGSKMGMDQGLLMAVMALAGTLLAVMAFH
ncbi:hypothetical protein AX16_005760 [Volvariella volvacea WC 439]|nr:hypothetical protein AX16_005760 [Volvariella volvacea WC 439]